MGHEQVAHGAGRSDPAGEAAATRRAVDHVAALAAPAAARLEALLEDTLTELLELPEEAGHLLHGDFKCDHILVDDDRLVLLDFDRVTIGDPALDVGKFTADLRWWAHASARDADRRRGRLPRRLRPLRGRATRPRPPLRRPLPAACGGPPDPAPRGRLGRGRGHVPRGGRAHPWERMMTTTWPAAPRGTAWTDVDPLIELIQPFIEAECRPGGVHQIRWEPGQRTRVTYDHRQGHVVVLEATRDSVLRSGLVDDSALPGLAEVGDPLRVAGRLEELLGEPVRCCVMTPVSYRPGSRCVIRGEVTLGSGGRTLFVKVLAGGSGDYVESHDSLADGLATTEPIVPPLVGCWPDLGAVVTDAAPGPSASTLLGDASSPASDRLRLAASIGGLLARIHRTTPGPHVQARRHEVADELGEVTSCLPAAWHADPAAALSLGWVLDRLGAALPGGGTRAFSHGSFRAGQVVVDDGRLAVLDLDSAGMADPARDLGNTMAYLDWQVIRLGAPAAPDLAGALWRGYTDGGGATDPDSLDWWHAAALLKIGGRRYRSLDTAHWDAVPSLVATASDLLERRGERTARSVAHVRHHRLPDISDPVSMTALLQEQLRAGGLGSARIISAETLRVAPGRRVVVRYRVAQGSEEPVEVIAKAFAERSRAVIAHENLVLFDGLREPGVRCGTQEPMGVRPHLGVVLCRSAEGLPLSPLPTAAPHPPTQERHALPDAAVVTAARSLGRWLRTVHATRAGASRRLDVGHEAANATLWAERIGWADARLLAPARELAVLLTSRVETLPVVPESLIHKDLHLGHVLVDDDGLATVIDLDEARMGDPAFDVAHLCAYAEEDRSPSAELAMRAFLDAYGEVRGPGAERRLAYFRAYTLLKITRQATAGRITDDVVRASGQRLGRGVTWLRG